MKIGAVYPQTELRGDPRAVRQFGQAVEALGFAHLLAYDHVIGAARDRNPPLWEGGPYDETHPFHDCFVMFSHLAAITQKLEFATGVLILPPRQTVLVARQAADVDLLSNGRLRLGVGVGWNYVEYDCLGQRFATRGRRIDEQIVLLRRLWEPGLVEFEGAFDSIDRACALPLPQRRIPIWLGGFCEAAFARGARLGDGFIFHGTTAGCIDAWGRVKAHLARADRSVAGFGADKLILAATPAAAADDIRRWRDSRERRDNEPGIRRCGRACRISRPDGAPARCLRRQHVAR